MELQELSVFNTFVHRLVGNRQGLCFTVNRDL
jgi:hypothetical protein